MTLEQLLTHSSKNVRETARLLIDLRAKFSYLFYNTKFVIDEDIRDYQVEFDFECFSSLRYESYFRFTLHVYPYSIETTFFDFRGPQRCFVNIGELATYLQKVESDIIDFHYLCIDN